MPKDTRSDQSVPEDWWNAQAEAAQALMAPFLLHGLPQVPAEAEDVAEWTRTASRLQQMWIDFQTEQAGRLAGTPAPFDPTRWMAMAQGLWRQLPLTDPEKQKQFWEEGLELWQAVLGQYGIGPNAEAPEGEPQLPRTDRRFRDPRWREQPVFALIHQTYLLVCEKVESMLDELDDLSEEKRAQLRFSTRAMLDALSPAHFPLTNPVVLERTVATKGENLVKGMEHLLSDLKRGQLTHTDPEAFELGRNIAVTPGKVVYENDLFQLIQYSPATDTVLEVPLVIFPPWINRFYILDLNPQKSFIKWAVEQGLSTFVVSWKSADPSMAEVVWDDYIAGQIEAIDQVRERLDVEAVHTIGYCVAGTTLAATLAVLAARGEADKVKSATFFTAQVDFEKAGELLNFIDDTQLAAIEAMAQDGYVDGRLMALSFNLLRGNDLIWNYVVNNYLLGEDYPAFDLLHWNGDVTNLPARWHSDYLRDLYRDNKLVQPGALEALGTPIDLTLVETPSYVQAGREDHIAPAESVWKITEHFRGPIRFVLAGSGHIAGVVNPPGAQKYQYWINEGAAASLDEFVRGATEHPGSWWPDWIAWLRGQDSVETRATGKRKPGGKGDKVIEDAPGRYVKTR